MITVANNSDLNGYVYYAQLYDNNYTPANSIKDKATGTKVDGAKAFTNTYTANNVVISKDIKGGLGDLAAKFTFKVKLTAADGKTANQYVGAKVVHSDDAAVTANTVWAVSEKIPLRMQDGTRLSWAVMSKSSLRTCLRTLL